MNVKQRVIYSGTNTTRAIYSGANTTALTAGPIGPKGEKGDKGDTGEQGIPGFITQSGSTGLPVIDKIITINPTDYNALSPKDDTAYYLIIQ